MKRICVFAGSSRGARSEYSDAARSLGMEIARRQLGLVYGGASVGLMMEVANAVLESDGAVTGVIPRPLVEQEVAHSGLTELRVVESMHQRKATMVELSDGFIAIPGGLGTLDELFEVLSWAQLGFHQKPCGLLNVCSYFDPLTHFLDCAVTDGFLSATHRSMLLVAERPGEILDRLASYRRPEHDKFQWIDRGKI